METIPPIDVQLARLPFGENDCHGVEKGCDRSGHPSERRGRGGGPEVRVKGKMKWTDGWEKREEKHLNGSKKHRFAPQPPRPSPSVSGRGREGQGVWSWKRGRGGSRRALDAQSSSAEDSVINRAEMSDCG